MSPGGTGRQDTFSPCFSGPNSMGNSFSAPVTPGWLYGPQTSQSRRNGPLWGLPRRAAARRTMSADLQWARILAAASATGCGCESTSFSAMLTAAIPASFTRPASAKCGSTASSAGSVGIWPNWPRACRFSSTRRATVNA